MLDNWYQSERQMLVRRASLLGELARLTNICLELSKIKVLKMLDLQTKSAIISNKLMKEFPQNKVLVLKPGETID
jgi:hypothetical protein